MTILASGTLTYTTPLVSARTEAGQDAYPGTLGLLSNYSEKEFPTTAQKIEGWKWDKRVWSASQFENTAGVININLDPTTSGVTKTYFQSGIGDHDDLLLKEIMYLPCSGINEDGIYESWNPQINHGYYYDYNNERYLFSDESEVEQVSYSGVYNTGYGIASGFNTLILSSTPKIGTPIACEILKWDGVEGEYLTDIKINRKTAFTGKLVDGERLSTWDTNTETFLWNNIDREKREFVIYYTGTEQTKIPNVIFNNQYSYQIGTTFPDDYEVLGKITGTNEEAFHLQFAPIDRNKSVIVYTAASGLAPSNTLWTGIDQAKEIVGNQIKVDYDLGIVSFGVSGVNNLPTVGNMVFASYWKVPRFEYEPSNTINELIATEQSINPLFRQNNKGFIYLSNKEENPASISLDAELTEINTDVFGPLNIGSAISKIIATVEDNQGNLLEGQNVNIFITSDPTIGSLGNNIVNTLVSTNHNGEAIAYYTSPGSINEIGELVNIAGFAANTPSTGKTTISTSGLLIDGTVSGITIYEVYTDDPVLGIATISGYYSDYFTTEEIVGPSGITGLDKEEWEANHRTIWDLTKPKLFGSSTGTGRKKLVAISSGIYLDPPSSGLDITAFTKPAIGPLYPESVTQTAISEYDITYAQSLTTPGGFLYGYFVVAPTNVKLQASVYNERTNQTILSNEISVKLSVPDYANGVWLIDEINNFHINEISALVSGLTSASGVVPFGFRLRTSNITLSSALDGITFLTVNTDTDDPETYTPESYTLVSGVYS